MRTTCSLLLPVILLAGATLCAQPFWQKKKYSSWSKDEVQKILQDSPWAVGYAFNAIMLDTLQRGGADSRSGESAPSIRYTVQLHSALPIRQALVRKEQLALKYDQLPPDKKQIFDQDAAKYLDAAYPDTILVHVNYLTTLPSLDRDLALYWQNKNPAELQSYMYLITPGGQRLSPLRLTVAKGGERSLDMVFPRKVDGKPVLDSPDGTLRLEFPHPRIGQIPDGRVLVEFKGSKMLVDGQPAY